LHQRRICHALRGGDGVGKFQVIAVIQHSQHIFRALASQIFDNLPNHPVNACHRE
jgi:hypothetical protein